MTNKFFAIGELNGVSLALADNVTAESLTEFKGELATFAAWEKAATEFARGYAQGRDVKIESGLTQWSRLMKMAGLTKPKANTVQAAKKAAQRATAKAAKGSDDVTAPVAGDTAAKALKIELSAAEANLVRWFREGKWAMINSMVAAAATNSALM